MNINATKLIEMLANMTRETCESWEEALRYHDDLETEKCRARAKALQEVMNKVLEMDKEEF